MTDLSPEARRPNVVCFEARQPSQDIHAAMADDPVHFAGTDQLTLCGLDHEQPMYTGRRATCARCKDLRAMTDTYRTATNPYAHKTEEARAKLERERAAAAEVKRLRADMLREVNEAIAPLYVYLHEGVRLTHAAVSYGLHLCDEADMLTRLPDIIGSTHFAERAESIERDASRLARRESLGLTRVARLPLLRRIVTPVSVSIGGTLLSCLIYGFEWTRAVFVLVFTLAFNLWYFGAFKRSTP